MLRWDGCVNVGDLGGYPTYHGRRTKFGSVKYVYDADTMRALRIFFEEEIAARLPQARILYWT